MPSEKIQIIVEGKDSGGTSVLGNLKNALGGVGTVAGGILAANLFGKITEGIASVGRTAIDAVGHAQTLEMQLEGLLAMNNMYTRQGKDIVATGLDFAQSMDVAKGQAQDLLSFVEKLAVVSPFETRQVEEVTRIGLAADMSTGMVKDFTRAFLDYSATVGIGSQDLAFAADQFLQLRKIGKLTTIDLRQLRRLGIDVEKILGAKMGMSVEQFNEKVEKSPELMDELFKSFIEFSGEVSEGAAQRMTQTIPGMMSTAKDLIEVGSKNLFRPMIDAISPALSGLLGKVSDFVTGPDIKVIGNLLGSALAGVLEGDITKVAANLGGFLFKIGVPEEKVNQFTNAIMRIEEAIFRVRGLVASFQTGGVGGLLQSLGVSPEELTRVQTAIQPVIDSLSTGFQGFITNLAPVKESFQGFLTTVNEASPGLQMLGNLIMTALGGALMFIGGMLPGLGTMISDIIGSALELIGDLLSFLSGVGTMLTGLFTGDLELAREGASQILTSLGDILTDTLGGGLQLVGDLLDTVSGGLSVFGDTTAGISEGIGQLGELVHGLGEAFSSIHLPDLSGFKDQLANLKIPDWLIPGSPPPLAFALQDVANAVRDLQNISANGLMASMPGNAPASASGPMTVEIPVHLDGQVITRVVASLLGEQVQQLQRMGGTARL